MTHDETVHLLRAAVLDVAPDLDEAEIEPDLDLRHDLDLDSMDFLNFVVAVKERLGVEIPEADYGKVRTLEACAAYVLAARG